MKGSLDKVISIHTLSRKFSCHSIRQEFLKNKLIISIWRAIWHTPISLKIKFFIWLLLRGSLPIRDRLDMFHLIGPQDNICPMCGSLEEDIYHLFFYFARTSILFSTTWQTSEI